MKRLAVVAVSTLALLVPMAGAKASPAPSPSPSPSPKWPQCAQVLGNWVCIPP